MSQIIPTAEPFLFPGSKTGCLLVHGFTGAPKEMRWLGEYLAGQGFSVLGVRLAGHATQPGDMIRSRHWDWMTSVEEGYHILKGLAEKIHLVGLSMGGVLSLLMATRLQVEAVVAMSTPYVMPVDAPVPLPVINLLSMIHPFIRKSSTPSEGWHDLEAFRQHVAYPQNPLRSGTELKLLLAEMREALPNVRVPVLLIHSRDDHYIQDDSMEKIYSHLGAADRQKVWVEGSGHVLTEEPKREEIYKTIADFIRRVDGSAHKQGRRPNDVR